MSLDVHGCLCYHPLPSPPHPVGRQGVTWFHHLVTGIKCSEELDWPWSGVWNPGHQYCFSTTESHLPQNQFFFPHDLKSAHFKILKKLVLGYWKNLSQNSLNTLLVCSLLWWEAGWGEREEKMGLMRDIKTLPVYQILGTHRCTADAF